MVKGKHRNGLPSSSLECGLRQNGSVYSNKNCQISSHSPDFLDSAHVFNQHPGSSNSPGATSGSSTTQHTGRDTLDEPIIMGNASSTAKTCLYGLTSAQHAQMQKNENSTLKNTLLFIIICISLGMLIYSSVKVISEYLEEPIAVETTLKNETDPRKMFPDIIVCSHRMASLEKLTSKLNFSTKAEKLAEELLVKLQNGEQVSDDFFLENGVDIDKYYNDILWHSSVMSYLPVDDLKSVKIARDEFVIDCQIKEYRRGREEIIDCLPYLEDSVTNEYGVCQRIRLTSKLRETAALFHGATYGLRMNLFLNTKDTSGGISSSTGIRVTVFDPEYPVIPQNSGVDVGPGIALSLAFRRFEYIKINRKSHNFECVWSRDWSSVLPPGHNGTIKGIEYASTDYMLCDQTCTSIYLQATCNCSSMHYFGEVVCVASHMSCVGANVEKLTESIRHCRDTMCKTSCRKVDYRTTTNQAMFPSEAFLPVFVGRILSNNSDVSPYIKQHVRQLITESGGDVNNTSMEKLRQEFVHLHVYRESSDTTIIEERNIYTEWSLLSNIGGNMGMFLGLSMVGFFKIAIRLKNRLGVAFKHYLENKQRKCKSVLLKSMETADM